MDLRHIPLRTRWPHPQDWYLCHRGADATTIEQIVAVMDTQLQQVRVQEGNTLSLSLPEFRAQVRRAVDGGVKRLIVLLNANFSGPIYRQTLGPILKKHGTTLDARCVRVEACETEGVERFLDLADVTELSQRITLILQLAPSAEEEIL